MCMVVQLCVGWHSGWAWLCHFFFWFTSIILSIFMVLIRQFAFLFFCLFFHLGLSSHSKCTCIFLVVWIMYLRMGLVFPFWVFVFHLYSHDFLHQFHFSVAFGIYVSNIIVLCISHLYLHTVFFASQIQERVSNHPRSRKSTGYLFFCAVFLYSLLWPNETFIYCHFIIAILRLSICRFDALG